MMSHNSIFDIILVDDDISFVIICVIMKKIIYDNNMMNTVHDFVMMYNLGKLNTTVNQYIVAFEVYIKVKSVTIL
jgi:hypothetical protein